LRIDSHQHFTPEYSPALLAPILKRNRFEGTVLVAGIDWEDYCEAEFVRAVVVAADLGSPDFPHALDHLQRNPKFRGVYCPFDAAPLPAGLAELARRDLTLDLPPRPELVPAIAERFPALKLVLQHVGRPELTGRPLDEWTRDLEIAAAHPELYAKISGLITGLPGRWHADQFRPAVRHALQTLGPQRLMYGSDWPSYLPEGTWKEALAAFTQSIGALPLETRELILGANAARFYTIRTANEALH
jgi:L-fuconolactonase